MDLTLQSALNILWIKRYVSIFVAVIVIKRLVLMPSAIFSHASVNVNTVNTYVKIQNSPP